MAKVTGPLQSNEARGKIGALIFNTWRGLATVKMFASPTQPRSARQLAIRAFLTTCARAWAGLTSGQRSGWTTWANDHPHSDWTGQPLRITGEDAYVGLNVRMLDMGFSASATCPTGVAPANVSNFVPTGGSGQISCAFTAYGGTATQIDIWAYGPHSAGRAATIVKARHKAYGPGETTPKVVTGLAAGLYTVYARAVSETDGQAAGWVSADATVT